MADTLPHIITAIESMNTQQLEAIRLETGPTGGVVCCLGNDVGIPKPYRVYDIGSQGGLSGRQNYATLTEAMVDYTTRRDADL